MGLQLPTVFAHGALHTPFFFGRVAEEAYLFATRAAEIFQVIVLLFSLVKTGFAYPTFDLPLLAWLPQIKRARFTATKGATVLFVIFKVLFHEVYVTIGA